VFIYLGMNDAQAMWLWPNERRAYGRQFLPWSDARWEALYVQRAQSFFERICQRGAHRTIVLLPVDVQRDRLQQRLKRIRELQARAAAASSCAVAVSTEGDMGRFEVAGVAKRKRDGLHLSPLGASAVWRRIEAQALRLVGASGPLHEPHGQPWCITPCRLGQGLRYRHTARPSEWADTVGITASNFGSGAGCAAW
jgi:lysophospholipase L1-like esterase